jgi:hypothetical protein
MLLVATGATAQSSPPATGPTPVSGQIQFGACPESSVTRAEGVMQTRGLVCHPVILEMSDPRFTGATTVVVSIDDRPGALTQFHFAFRIESEDGAWQQVPTIVFAGPDGEHSTATIEFQGEGAYQGLTAVVELDLTGEVWDVQGYIFEGEIPPLPNAAP